MTVSRIRRQKSGVAATRIGAHGVQEAPRTDHKYPRCLLRPTDRPLYPLAPVIGLSGFHYLK